MNRLSFYWDIGSTNTYFAYHLLKPLAAKYQFQIDYHPFNLGYVFRHHKYTLMEEPAAKLRNRKQDLMRWAHRHRLPFKMPDKFPIKTSLALRGSLVMRQLEKEGVYLEKIFARYWENNDSSIDSFSGLRAVATELGVDADEFEQATQAASTRDCLIDLTQTALDEGVFGAPSIKIENQLYWGKDRMEFVEDHMLSLTK